jgi:hypothetical protein
MVSIKKQRRRQVAKITTSSTGTETDKVYSARLNFAVIRSFQDGSRKLFVNGHRTKHSIELPKKSDPLKFKLVVEGLQKVCDRDNIDPVSDDHLRKCARKAFYDHVRSWNGSNGKRKRNGNGNGNGKGKRHTTTTTRRHYYAVNSTGVERENGEEEKDPWEKPLLPPIDSFDEWQKGLTERYDNLKKITQTAFAVAAWQSLEFTLSVKNILHVKDITLPFAGAILGKPSGWKTFGIEMLRDISPHTHYSDAFTPKAWVSHISGIPEEERKDMDMLPKVKNKAFLTPELAPIFAAKEEELMSNLAIITRVLDGHGYENDSGACGHRGYTGRFMFVWVGALVKIHRQVYKKLSALGPKLYFYRVDAAERDDKDYIALVKNRDFEQRRGVVRQLLADYFQWFDRCPRLETIKDETGKEDLPVKKIEWGPDSDELIGIIVKFARLLGHLRAEVSTWEITDASGEIKRYDYHAPEIEEPSRAVQQLYNLARGHALAEGRTYVDKEKDLTIVSKVVLSTAPKERALIFNLLLKNNGTLTTTEVANGLNMSPNTAKSGMRELKALELVDIPEPTESNEQLRMVLRDGFDWLLKDEFKDIWTGQQKKNPKDQTTITEYPSADGRENGGDSSLWGKKIDGSRQLSIAVKNQGVEREQSKNDNLQTENTASYRSYRKQRQEEAKPATYFACPEPGCEEQLEEPVKLLEHIHEHCPEREDNTRWWLQARGLLPEEDGQQS